MEFENVNGSRLATEMNEWNENEWKCNDLQCV